MDCECLLCDWCWVETRERAEDTVEDLRAFSWLVVVCFLRQSSPGYPGISSVDQAGLELTEIHPPASASWVLGLKALRTQQDLSFVSRVLSVMVHTCDPSTGEDEAEGSLQSHPLLHSKFEASLGCIQTKYWLLLMQYLLSLVGSPTFSSILQER